ncbi:glycosyltransferase family 32 protein [Bradyrhizobium diversitatis]|uniref:Mannosyltransferase n=1 Tax=Bradyrhizobium diversitatis TaxID=2755406 RepID=A0ABS0PEN2_9BRAD|nr:glycosyltransferase [Bradyrhizobium diversitatis]MBH5391769.1 hypothetical protein [Bradyrhizobium diversitatis]
MPSRIDMTDGPEHHRQRSEFIRGLVQRSDTKASLNDRYEQAPPKSIVQFWHDLGELPADIKECIATWARWATSGYTHRLFDEDSAREFIREALDARHEDAFERCYHPAMQADYFRLCYLFVEGGLYVDADDVCVSTEIDSLFDDGRLKVQPLCYDIASGGMVDTARFLSVGAYEPSWIFYVNNNPLISSKRHPIIERALQRATDLLQDADGSVLPEIQTTTGPGNLSRSIFERGAESAEADGELVVLRDWESFAVSRWPLSHRNDARNWRLSNQQRFRRGEN